MPEALITLTLLCNLTITCFCLLLNEAVKIHRCPVPQKYLIQQLLTAIQVKTI